MRWSSALTMKMQSKTLIVLMAEDDADDRLMVEEAWKEIDSPHDLRFVMNGEELLNYVYHREPYQESGSAPVPSLILLDLNMPKVDGREVVKTMKVDPVLKRIPIVIFSTSDQHEDVVPAYDLGVNGYITKPLTFDDLVATMKMVNDYWLSLTTLPPQS